MIDLDDFIQALRGCDTVKVILTGVGEQTYTTKEIYDAITERKMISKQKLVAYLKDKLQDALNWETKQEDAIFIYANILDAVKEGEFEEEK
jgi:hypothetical protein